MYDENRSVALINSVAGRYTNDIIADIISGKVSKTTLIVYRISPKTRSTSLTAIAKRKVDIAYIMSGLQRYTITCLLLYQHGEFYGIYSQ